MKRSENHRIALVLGVAVPLLVITAGVIVLFYSQRQLEYLASEPVFSSPRDGMVEWYLDHGAERVDITHAAQEYPLLNNLWFVTAEVRLASGVRRELGAFFLRTRHGWVFVPEGRFPGVIAVGERLLSILDPKRPPNTAFQRTRARGGRGPGPLNSNR